jgi:hypothetical protein
MRRRKKRYDPSLRPENLIYGMVAARPLMHAGSVAFLITDGTVIYAIFAMSRYLGFSLSEIIAENANGCFIRRAITFGVARWCDPKKPAAGKHGKPVNKSIFSLL